MVVGAKEDVLLADSLFAGSKTTDFETMPECRGKLPDKAMTFEAETQEWVDVCVPECIAGGAFTAHRGDGYIPTYSRLKRHGKCRAVRRARHGHGRHF
jgi:hypothetical protein